MWMNGGPGASSLTGYFVENIGPYTMNTENNQTVLKLNDNRWTKFAHILIFDNPVGAGYSYTTNNGYVQNEEEMASQLTQAIDQFLTLHPEYRNNDFWISGESYAGKYIPNLAQYIDENLSKYKINLKGVMMGNGM